MNAPKAMKVLSLVFYLLYLVFFSIEAEPSEPRGPAADATLRLAHPSRAPSGFASGERPAPRPVRAAGWGANLFAEDDAGVLKSTKKQMRAWRRTERYRSLWGLASRGPYRVPGSEEQKRLLQRNLVKYADKRLSGELKRAEEGTALHRVKKVEQALAPKVEARIVKNVRLRFKARVLQRKARIIVANPYLTSDVVLLTSGKATARLGKDFKRLGVSGNLEYDLGGGRQTAVVQKRLTGSVTASISSSQPAGQAPFLQGGERTLRLTYRSRFP